MAKIRLTCFYGSNAPGDIVEVDAAEYRRLIDLGAGKAPPPDEEAATEDTAAPAKTKTAKAKTATADAGDHAGETDTGAAA